MLIGSPSSRVEMNWTPARRRRGRHSSRCPPFRRSANPAPGKYTVYVNGYTVFGPLVGDHETGSRAAKTDSYKLRLFVE